MTARSLARGGTAFLAVGLTLALVACTAGGGAGAGGRGAAAGASQDAAAPLSGDAVSALPVEQISSAAIPHLADGVAPPTSRWYASLAFSDPGVPVYPTPLAFLATGDGFTVQRPAVSVSPTSIAAPFTGGLHLDLGATDYRVARTDPVSVTIAYTDATGPRARVTIAEGSPIVAVAAESDLDLVLPETPTEVAAGAWTVTLDGAVHLLVAPQAETDGSALRVPAGGTLQVAVPPDDGDPAAWAAAIGEPVTGVAVTGRVGDEGADTRLDYEGTDRTVVVPFAGLDAGSTSPADDCTLGTYDTPYGAASACASTTLEWSVPRIAPAAEYDLAGTDDATRASLLAQASDDLAVTGALPDDTYFGGKALARLGDLLSLARTLGDADLATRIADRLAAELEPWTVADGCATRAAKCFVYDDRLHLVVGKEVGFGAEDGNDHHFHYGYFLAAAGALAAARPDLVDELRPVMNALAADVAGGSGDALTALRVFDPYRGHSWAAGLAPFADGNNQESSSEAVAAWNGLALWAEASGDDELLGRAAWLLSNEAAAARTLWLDPADLPAGYAHTIVSISWGAKRDYATWFSAEPSAILGIQALPLGPVSLEYLAGDPARVAENVADAGDTAFTGPLGDYVQAYSALGSPDAASAAATAFAARTTFDDGWSKALALAWVAAVQARSG
ncbi:glycosyl hydrolase [uncultured Microbacterium sp.]|uniref:glycosyl hydrolase n=1 Tax=uncultured Microbacterium sp. TaxID=191216 RepID=UPI002599E9BD|nr:glycosyl hydrolase [uncultured Microbacterium sp.]